MAIRLHRLAWAERTALRLIKQYGAPCTLYFYLPGTQTAPGRVGPSREVSFKVNGLTLTDLTELQIPADVKFSQVVLVAASEVRMDTTANGHNPPSELFMTAKMDINAAEGKETLFVKHVQIVRPNGNNILYRLFLGK